MAFCGRAFDRFSLLECGQSRPAHHRSSVCVSTSQLVRLGTTQSVAPFVEWNCGVLRRHGSGRAAGWRQHCCCFYRVDGSFSSNGSAHRARLRNRGGGATSADVPAMLFGLVPRGIRPPPSVFRPRAYECTHSRALTDADAANFRCALLYLRQ